MSKVKLNNKKQSVLQDYDVDNNNKTVEPVVDSVAGSDSEGEAPKKVNKSIFFYLKFMKMLKIELIYLKI